jgi:hypothetical protein
MDQLEIVSLNSRLDAINEAQKRSRVALLLSTLAAGAILLSLWNAYFSWDRQWADITKRPESWGQEQLLAEQIKAWAETNIVGISLLGVRLSVSDAAILGSLVLSIFAFYYCMCLRRENHEIGSMFVDAKGMSAEAIRLVFMRVRSHMIFSTTSGNDAAYTTLDYPTARKKIFFSRFGFRVLTFLPAITILVIVFSDIYFSFFYVSPWRRNEGPAWYGLSESLRTQLLVTDAIAVFMLIVAINFCRHSDSFQRATKHIVEEFGRDL